MANAISVEKHDPQGPAEWHDHIAQYGYVIVHNVLPEENLAATIDDIWRHTGANPNDPDSWYRRDIVPPVGMVEMTSLPVDVEQPPASERVRRLPCHPWHR